MTRKQKSDHNGGGPRSLLLDSSLVAKWLYSLGRSDHSQT